MIWREHSSFIIAAQLVLYGLQKLGCGGVWDVVGAEVAQPLTDNRNAWRVIFISPVRASQALVSLTALSLPPHTFSPVRGGLPLLVLAFSTIQKQHYEYFCTTKGIDLT